MSRAIDTLTAEHRVIEQVLDSLEAFIDGLRPGGGTDRNLVAEYAEFFREFADRCHHGKEEERLFTLLGEHGLSSQAGPVAVMLHEHDLGRSHVRAFSEVGSGSGPLTAEEVGTVSSHAAEFIPLLRQHIQKEDGVLFPLAERVLGPNDLDRLARQFDEFESGVMGDGAHEALHALADRLVSGAVLHGRSTADAPGTAFGSNGL